MRPRRRYYIEFMHGQPTPKLVKLFAIGETPCRAKAHAHEMLERLLAISPELPKQGWQVTRQEDRGIVD